MERKWWQEAVGYQIYPKTFKDSNNDGIGDIQGIISKLSYLKHLGVNLLWICPFYKSPMDDNGYDVSDYFEVNKIFGSLDDVKELIEKAHELEIKIILDLVMNQTSDEHSWFIESRKNLTNDKRDYYIWKKGKIDENGNLKEPNNWASFFGGSCWKYDETTNEFYMKIFSDKMPDLNWENEKMREEMKKMICWWLDNGADGFRVDAIAHLAKDQSFADSEMEKDGFGYCPDWQKFSNRDRLYDYLTELNQDVFSKYDCLTIGEVGGGASTADALRYSGFDVNRFSMVFTFDHCWENGAFGSLDKQDDEIKTNLVNLKRIFARWQNDLYGKCYNPLYWLNHDHPRVISQYGNVGRYHKESGKMLATTLHMMWGMPFIYNGEEIGMTNVDYDDINDFNDVSAKNAYNQFVGELGKEQVLRYLRRCSRDNARTPMQWSSEKYAGFSEVEPVVKVVGNYKWINVESNLKDEDSILNHYRKLIQLRRNSEYSDIIIDGSFTLIDEDNPNVFSYLRRYNGRSLLVVSNFFEKETKIGYGYKMLKVVLSNYHHNDYNLNDLTLRPYESIIFEIYE